MRKCIIRAAFALTLLLTLGAVFGGVNSASARAATASVAHVVILKPMTAKESQSLLAKAATPIIYRTSCTSGTFNIFADYNSANNDISNVDCFASAAASGNIGVTIYNVIAICAGNMTGSVIGHNDGEAYFVDYVFPHIHTCYHLRSGARNYVNVVSSITMSNLMR